MNTELKFMFEFQAVIASIQERIVAARIAKVPEEKLKLSIENANKLIEIYNHFDAYYYKAHFSEQKILQLEADKIAMSRKIAELESEKEKLLKSLSWENQQ